MGSTPDRRKFLIYQCPPTLQHCDYCFDRELEPTHYHSKHTFLILIYAVVTGVLSLPSVGATLQDIVNMVLIVATVV